jgi:hypothetical protein
MSCSHLFKIFALGLCWLASGACSKSSQDPQKPVPEPTPQVSLLMYAKDLHVANLKSIISSDEFTTAFPNVTVNVLPWGDNMSSANRVPTCMVNDNCADIEFMERSVAWLLRRSDIFYDLSDPKFGVDISQFNEHQKAVILGPSGEIYGIPFDSPAVITFYRFDVAKQLLTTVMGKVPTDDEVATYMNSATWDKLITELAPLAYQNTEAATKSMDKLNQGYRLYLLRDGRYSLAMVGWPHSAPWVLNGQLNPVMVPYIMKHVKLHRMLMRGAGTGERPMDDAAQIAARNNSYIASVRSYKKLDGTNLFAAADLVDETAANNFGGFFMFQGAVWEARPLGWIDRVAAPYGVDFSGNAQSAALAAGPAEDRILARYVDSTLPGAPNWATGLYAPAYLPKIEAEYGLTAGENAYGISGGTYFAVTKACAKRIDGNGVSYNCEEWAGKVAKFLATSATAQKTWWTYRYAFPSTKSRVNIPTVESFLQTSPLPILSTIIDGIGQPGSRPFGYGICYNDIQTTYQTIVNKYVSFIPDPANPLVADLTDASLAQVQQAIIDEFTAAMAGFLADTSKCLL